MTEIKIEGIQGLCQNCEKTIEIKWKGKQEWIRYDRVLLPVLQENGKIWQMLKPSQRHDLIMAHRYDSPNGLDFSKPLGDVLKKLADAEAEKEAEEIRRFNLAKETISSLKAEIEYVKGLGKKPVKPLTPAQKTEIDRIITSHPKFRDLMDGGLLTPFKRAFVPNECWDDLKKVCPTIQICPFRVTRHQQKWADANTVTIRGVFADVVLFNGARPHESIVQEKIRSLQKEIGSIKNNFRKGTFD